MSKPGEKIRKAINDEIVAILSARQNIDGSDHLSHADPAELTPERMKACANVPAQRFECLRREQAVRNRIQNEWTPLRLQARTDAHTKAHADCEAAAIDVETATVEALAKIGYPPDVRLHGVTLCAHPRVAATATELDRASVALNERGDLNANAEALKRIANELHDLAPRAALAAR